MLMHYNVVAKEILVVVEFCYLVVWVLLVFSWALLSNSLTKKYHTSSYYKFIL